MHRNTARTVLIIEPDADSRTALRSTFERDGYTVVATAGADDALSVVDSPEISLVVTELYLGSGKDRCLLNTFRHSGRANPARVLAYTRHASAKDRAWAIAQGADGYVLKRNGEKRLLEVAERLGRPTHRKRRGTRKPETH